MDSEQQIFDFLLLAMGWDLPIHEKGFHLSLFYQAISQPRG